MDEKKKRHLPNAGEMLALALRAVLILTDWFINGSGPR
ncbi:hypothetical protein SAMN05421505_15518 [Sinosporangium album]|uniref:Uncharacterized protein n=1 Tax=Sinosporangium album TaxID=504805 RepID=A0A1G8KUK8_9ACTN|nr:hypothetical protein SAMN05421505_15518 [Sinosporangium album]